ncbi:MAG TPA: rubrerythrin family protein [Terracidiphilus sp.]|nr:rubrerythrin family protein [Terracidiphilus sp.]
MAFGGDDERTVRNLLTAYDTEMNAHARYKVYAAKADEESFLGVGSLFRAAARAEQIHASNQARALRQSGGEARANVVPAEVASTLENLQEALKGEKQEIEVLYPKFAEDALAGINALATRAFTLAMEAEKTHVELYTGAIAQIESGDAGSWVHVARDFHVCPMCAFTTDQKVESNCPVCGYPSERFETVA